MARGKKPFGKKPKKKSVFIYGKHALHEALLHAPEAVGKVYLKRSIDDHALLKQLQKHNIQTHVMSGQVERNLPADTVHQGIMASFNPQKILVDFKSYSETMPTKKDTAFLLLDEVTDPHNVGAVIRSAAAFGFAGVLLPEHNQAPLTGAVIKTSVGMAFRIPLIQVGNVNTALRTLKEKGFWIYGLDAQGESLPQTVFDAPSVFVLGNEGRGIRAKTLDLCDTVLSIPMDQRCESLNAAQAATVAMYTWYTRT